MRFSKALSFMPALGGMLVISAYPALAAGANNGIDANDGGAMIAALGTSAVPSSQLAKMRGGAGGVAAINLGTDTNNSADNSVTGSITNLQSVNGNTGLTTVLQNTGNNSLLQSSMTVNITVY